MKTILSILLIIISAWCAVGATLPFLYETTDSGLAYLNTHGFGSRVWGVPGIIALVSAAIAGGIIGGFKDYFNWHWAETVQAETRYNPAWGIFFISILIQLAWIALLE
jgi:hypothetical protein